MSYKLCVAQISIVPLLELLRLNCLALQGKDEMGRR